jgi:hypothetical protein
MSYKPTEKEVIEMAATGELLPVAAIAALLGLPPITVRRRLVRDGIPTYRIRRRVYAPAASIGPALTLP